MTLVDVFGFVRVAIREFYVMCGCANERVQCSAVDDERQTIDARAPYVCVCVFARWKRERREMNDDGLNETRRRRRRRRHQLTSRRCSDGSFARLRLVLRARMSVSFFFITRQR